MRRYVALIRPNSLFVGFLCAFMSIQAVVAQEAANEKSLLGDVDVQESGLIVEGADATDALSKDAESAFREEVDRDLGYLGKGPKNAPSGVFPTPEAPRATSTINVSTAPPAVTPTIDAALESIAHDIDKLQQEEHELD